MKTVKDFNVKNKRVLLRCDFNVPLVDELRSSSPFANARVGDETKVSSSPFADARVTETGKIADDFRIQQTLPTILHLIKKMAKVILISHLGKPEGVKSEKYSLKPVAKKLEELLKKPVLFLDDCVGERIKKKIDEMKPSEVVLLENLRFYKGEEENDPEFAKNLSRLGDFYINDAFGCSHRAHASIALIPKYLPSGAGLLLEREIKTLSKISEDPRRPLIVIIGGVKIATKIKAVERFLVRADHLLLGGQIANAILQARGVSIGKPILEEYTPEITEKIKKINLTNSTLHLPVDVTLCLGTLKEGYIRETAIGSIRKEEQIFDLGPETVKLFTNIIEGAKTIFWNGPLGYVEDERFVNGSLAVADAILKSKAFSVAGGGDTDAFLAKYNLRKQFSHVSTGGGAMLDFLSGEQLPGIEALK